MRDGWPFVNTLHHPITVDRDLELDARDIARAAGSRCAVGTGSSACRCRSRASCRATSRCRENSKKDIVAQMGVDPDTLHIVPVGVDQKQFRPMPHVAARARAA